MNDDQLAAVALRLGWVEPTDLAACLSAQRDAEEQGEPPMPLAQLLIQRALISGTQLSELLLSHSGTGALLDRPRRLGRYELLEEVAEGGTATVYRAHDPTLGRDVALKVLRPDVDAGMVTRLYREAVAAAQMRHPNIVQIHEVGEVVEQRGAQPTHFIAMDLVEGRTLASAMYDMSRAEKLRVIEQVAEAIGHAHERGLIHRDLKPLNILIQPDGRPIITDFGLAHWDAYCTRLTRSGVVVGTYHYMAPEQVRGKVSELDPRTDVWALGVMLYELLTGDIPFDAKTPGKLYQKILGQPMPPMPAEVSRRLERICSRALSKAKADRFGSGRALAEALRDTRPAAAPAPSGGGRLLLIGLVASLVVAAIPILAALLASGPGPQPPEPPGAVAKLPTRPSQPKRSLDSELAQAIDRAEQQSQDPAADPGPALERVGLLTRRLAEQTPERGGARSLPLIGVGWYLIGRYDKAQKALEQALTRDPRAVTAHLYLGRIYLRRVLQSHTVVGKPVPKGLALRASAAFTRAGDDRLAEACGALAALNRRALREICRSALESASSSHPEELWLLRGWTHRPASDDRSRCWERALQIRPHDPWLLFFKAVTLDQRGDPASAEELLDRAIALAELGSAHLVRGCLRSKRRDNEGAVADFSRAIALDSRDHPSLLNRARVLLRLSRMPEALADCNVTIKLAPADPEAYRMRAKVLIATRQHERALRDLNRALKLDADRPSTWLARGNVYRKLRRLRQAQADFGKAIELAPRDPRGHVERGRVRAARGDRAGALADFRRALELKPDLWPAMINAGRLLIELGQEAAGAAMLKRAEALAPAEARRRIREMTKKLKGR